jgi:hypothetical protein
VTLFSFPARAGKGDRPKGGGRGVGIEACASFRGQYQR